MASKIVLLLVVVLFAAVSLAAPTPDPKAQLLAAAPLTYSLGAYPYAAYSSYVSPYASYVSPYASLAYPGLAYSYTYPYAIV